MAANTIRRILCGFYRDQNLLFGDVAITARSDISNNGASPRSVGALAGAADEKRTRQLNRIQRSGSTASDGETARDLRRGRS
jgi:hypothetical protein